METSEPKAVMKRAADFMIPLEKYPHIPYWFTIRQAVAALEKSELEIEGKKSLPRALLVFDEQYQLLGMVRRRDILRGLEPKFMRTIPPPSRRQLFEVEADPNLVLLSSSKIVQAIREQAEQPVSEIMQPIASTVDVEDHLTKVVYKMVSRDLALIPVLKDQKVVGVVRSVDAFRQFAKLLI
jgi:CBS-domain-containing membrane protein